MAILPLDIQLKGVLKRIATNGTGYAVAVFMAFILAATLKTAIFNRLIVGSGALPRTGEIFSGFTGKLILFVAVMVILSRFRRRIFILVFYALHAVYVAVNLQYFLSFQGYLHISQYAGLFSEAFDLVTHAAIPWDGRSLFLLMDLPFFIGVLVVYPRLYSLNKRFFFKPVMYCSSIVFIYYFYKWEIPAESPLRAMNDAYASDVSVVKKYGLLTFNIMDLLNYRDAQSHIKSLNYGPRFTCADTGGPRPNFVFIQVESLDGYILNYKHKKKFVTPYLRALSRECVFYPYVLSYHMAGATSDCEFSTINSVEPFDNFPSIKIRNYDYPNSLLKRFTSNGYDVIAFHGNRGTYFNRKSAFKKMGFQTFYDMQAMHLPEIGWGTPDDSVFDFVTSAMSKQKQPFLYYVITMSSHEPFTIIKKYYSNDRFDDITDGPKRNYLNSMSYMDQTLKKFIGHVLSTYPNTIIVMYGDHTPSLPKCGYAKARLYLNHRQLEFVPLFIILPEKKVYREKKIVASFLDIAPTVLSAGRLGASINTHGLNLLDCPAADKAIPYRRDLYSRKELFSKISRKR